MDQNILLRVLVWIAGTTGRLIEKYGDPLPHGLDLEIVRAAAQALHKRKLVQLDTHDNEGYESWFAYLTEKGEQHLKRRGRMP